MSVSEKGDRHMGGQPSYGLLFIMLATLLSIIKANNNINNSPNNDKPTIMKSISIEITTINITI